MSSNLYSQKYRWVEINSFENKAIYLNFASRKESLLSPRNLSCANGLLLRKPRVIQDVR